ncbi:MAG: NAD(+) synthase [Nevskia sp.]|nr:NAD(+) synthase [Nevskia sp.]
MGVTGSFFNLYRHGFVRVAAAVPEVRVADPAFNAARCAELMHAAATQHARYLVFPELGLSAYSCEDLFHQQALLDGCASALRCLLEATRALPLVGIVGLPLRVEALLFNCAAVFCGGRILGLVPKSYLPTYREFYELRQFAPAAAARTRRVTLGAQTDVPFGPQLLFDDVALDLRFAVELCEDLWVPLPPSSLAALAGASLLFNLSASNATVGKADFRRQLVADQSARCMAGYVYCAAGAGESTTDLAWDGHALVAENGTLLAESRRYAPPPQLLLADLNLDRLRLDRMRTTSFGQSVQQHRERLREFETVPVSLPPPDCSQRLLLLNPPERCPYVPADPARRRERCAEVQAIQMQGLVTRLRATRIEKVVLGVSGGLDSTLALLVCAGAMDALKLPRTHVLACTLPGFATAEHSLGRARELTAALGCTPLEIDIRPSCMQMLRDLRHPAAGGAPQYDLTYENVQAGERTSHLFRLANFHNGLVVGTSDLSELALGWCTYGVGDHMAHYDVNASVPKTLVQYLIAEAAENDRFGPAASSVLRRVLAARITPELTPDQSSEAVIGPYALQDFNLYHLLRFGDLPSKVAFLAYNAWRDGGAAPAPPGVPGPKHCSIGEIKRWLGVFLDRFFRASQFKRSCLPNAPKVGSGGSLSPRGDYRAPSDSDATVWLADLATVPDQEGV